MMAGVSDLDFPDVSDYIDSCSMPTSSTPSQSSGDTTDDADHSMADGFTNDDHISFPEPSFGLPKVPTLSGSQQDGRLDDDRLEVTIEEVQALFAVEEAKSTTETTSATTFVGAETTEEKGAAEAPSSNAHAPPDLGRKISPSNSRKTLMDDSASSKRPPTTKPKRRTLAFLSARDRPLAVRPAPRPQAMWMNVHQPQSAPGMHVWGTPIPQSPGGSPVGPPMGTPFNNTGVPHGSLPAQGKQAIGTMAGSPLGTGQVTGSPIVSDTVRHTWPPSSTPPQPGMGQSVMAHPMQVQALGQPINQPMVAHQPLPAQHMGGGAPPLQSSMPMHGQSNIPPHQPMQAQPMHPALQPHAHHMGSHQVPHHRMHVSQDPAAMQSGASSRSLGGIPESHSPQRMGRHSTPGMMMTMSAPDALHHPHAHPGLQHPHAHQGRHSLQQTYSSPQLQVPNSLFMDPPPSFPAGGPIGLSLRKSTSLADLLNAAR
eukprot:CAMPEP_0118928564 /NCGR_PEP_ID=MMETSP1169-20130426/5791_1 /TAXON_ID=36882 /ORGANISM="Pyramimonas obovata, Strain CCMP722" /LENGTH=482 /DNA_ID=CAMNT_0006870581 /DNA_START=83 /DNA_END=1531 /DNA_ORIENTATION=-